MAPVVERELWLHDRCLPVAGLAAGWWRLEVRGRAVTPLGAATEGEVERALAALPVLRGPLVRVGGGWALVAGGGMVAPIDLPRGDGEPPLLAPLKARRWPAGALVLWDELEWEGEVETVARRALDDGHVLAGVRGVSAALRAAFALATAAAAGRALGIAAAPVELRRWLRDIAERGRPAAESALRALAVERASWAASGGAQRRLVTTTTATGTTTWNATGTTAAGRAAWDETGTTTPADAREARLEAALRASGARLLGQRQAAAGLVEVRWQLGGERFISIVEDEGLRVVDSGVCLAGSDSLVTLDSLPGVIREAIEADALVITRHEED